MKVHVLEADMTGQWNIALEKRDDMGRAVAALAKQVNEPVFFHDFKDPVAGAPVVMIECSDAFLAEVKKLPEVKNVHDVWGNMPTERAPHIQQYFDRPKYQTPPRNPHPPRRGPTP